MARAKVSRAIFFKVLKRSNSMSAAARECGINKNTASLWVSQRRSQLRPLVMPQLAPRSKTDLLRMTAPYVLHPEAPAEHFEAWLRFFVREFGGVGDA